MKHEIEIPELPEGWKAVAHRVPRPGEMYLRELRRIAQSDDGNMLPYLIVEKIQPRRIVLEETGQTFNNLVQNQHFEQNGIELNVSSRTPFKLVKEE